MFKKAIALLGSLAVVGLGASFAQTTGQSANRAEVRKRSEVRNRSQFRDQFRYRFVDENGDGINDLLRDSDGDGVPNCQDPDWAPPRDGSGYHGGNGNGGGGPRGFLGSRAGFRGAGRGMSRGAFRGARGGFGTGVCDGTGPKGNTGRGRAR